MHVTGFVAFTVGALLLTPAHGAAQTVLTLLDGRKITVRESAMRNFASSEAANAVSRIVQVAGLSANFNVLPVEDGSVGNAAAAMDETASTRLILYKPAFIQSVSGGGRAGWGALGVLAHEIGHHLNGHTLGRGQVSRDAAHRQELEADEFAAVQLARLGGTQAEALAMLDSVRAGGTFTHPPRAQREQAVRRGWCTGRGGKPAVGFAPADGATGCSLGGATVAAVPAVRTSPWNKQILLLDFTRGPSANARMPVWSKKELELGFAFNGYAMIQKDYTEEEFRVDLSFNVGTPVFVEAVGSVVAGDRKASKWGLGFGAGTSRNDYFVFQVTTNGEVLFYHRTPGSRAKEIVAQVAHSAVKPGVGSINRLAVAIEGTKARLTVNGTTVRTVELGLVPSGQLMLINNGSPRGDTDTTVAFTSVAAWTKE